MVKRAALILLSILIVGCSRSDKPGTNGKYESDLIRENVKRILEENSDDFGGGDVRADMPGTEELEIRMRALGQYVVRLTKQGEAGSLTYAGKHPDFIYVPEQIVTRLGELEATLNKGHKLEIEHLKHDDQTADYRLVIISKYDKPLLRLNLVYQKRHDKFYFITK